MNAQIIARWIQDDGSVTKYGLRLATMNFNLHDHILLHYCMNEKLGIRVTISRNQKAKTISEKVLMLYITAEGKRELFERFKYTNKIVKSMIYKIDKYSSGADDRKVKETNQLNYFAFRIAENMLEAISYLIFNTKGDDKAYCSICESDCKRNHVAINGHVQIYSCKTCSSVSNRNDFERHNCAFNYMKRCYKCKLWISSLSRHESIHSSNKFEIINNTYL